MRILFDSKQPQFKTPFGTLLPGQECTLNIHIPAAVGTVAVVCAISCEDGNPAQDVALALREKRGDYDIWGGSFTFREAGLFFYYFRITGNTGTFRLFKQGDDTNMEAGDCWQVSCVTEEFPVPDWALGATMYQIFPDRFHKSGEVCLQGKLEPYTIHGNWNEEVDWRPDHRGLVLNNDFFGGNFRGIGEKMDYLASLGVTVLYLNPISKSYSSHRYDTGDYKTPDPMLGTEEDFTAMCHAAHQRGIRVILDGVFSHTGSNSLYFDREGVFGGNGAYNSPNSPFYHWYDFQNYPNRYTCWWNFDTLPTVKKLEESFLSYIITDEDSVVAYWLRAGADGFRLDVVDELPDAFVLLLKKRLRELKPDALLIGEVWEDASNKSAYGVRRRYFVDGELDSVMNYPFRTAILNFLRERDDGQGLRSTVMALAENYPREVLLASMTLLGTHDTARVLTALVDDFQGSRAEKAQRHLSMHQYLVAKERLFMASFLQYALPGTPCVYYGDEAGMEGHEDPFNRRPFPWGREDAELQAHYRGLGQLRRDMDALRLGDVRFFHAGGERVGFCRSYQGQNVQIYVNRSHEPWQVPAGKLLYGHNMHTVSSQNLTVGAMGFCAVEG